MVAKTVFEQVKLDVNAYNGFLLSRTYLYPASSNGVYSASKLTVFFERAQKKLKQLLSRVPCNGSPLVVSSNEEILHKYVLIGHGKTGTNKEGKLTGWSGDMLCASWGKKDDEIGGIEQALEHADRMNLGDYHLRFVSDLPRAIHHALLLTKDAKLRKTLDSLSSSISNEIQQKGNIVYKKLYKKLISLALQNGFIPTPLLRAQYYGPLELGPDKLEKEDRQRWIDGVVGKALKLGLNVKKARHEAEWLAEELIERKELLRTAKDNKGNVLTENRLNLVNRTVSFYDAVNKASVGKKVLVVTSSSFFDSSNAYFDNFGKRKKQLIIENEPKQSGRQLEVKLGSFNGKPCYLTDPKRIEEIKKSSAAVALRQREASLDEGIKNQKYSSSDEEKKDQKNPVIPVELLGFKKKEHGKYDSFRVTLDDILKFDMPTKPTERITPTLLLGNFGQGKSTAAVELTEKLNTDKEYKNRYVAVFLTARDINQGLLNKLLSGEGTGPTNDSTILDLLSQGVPSLPLSLRNEYKPVFIIDALDEISENLRKNVIHVARDLLPEYGKVIATSRFTGFETYENKEFDTFHLDPSAVIRNLDVYLAGRILDKQGAPDSQRLKEFKELLMRQDEGVKTNYLLVHFLSNMYNKNPEELVSLNKPLSEGEILIRGIEHALWDHKATKRVDMQKPSPYEGQSSKDLKEKLDKYEKERSECLFTWMDFLQRTAAYMTVHNTSTIDRKGLEEVQGGWTIEKYLSKSKVK